MGTLGGLDTISKLETATYSELLVAFDELTVEAGLADVKCHDCDQPRKFKAHKRCKYPGAQFLGKVGDWCFVCHMLAISSFRIASLRRRRERRASQVGTAGAISPVGWLAWPPSDSGAAAAPRVLSRL